MAKPNEITSIRDICYLAADYFHDWKQYGEVYEVEDGDLVLLNYTPAAQYARRWNFFERVCRGLIIDRSTGEVAARPFDKFFNWGEATTDSPLIEATEKMDGSLGILYRADGQYKVATRGAFHSEQAEWATRKLRYHNLESLDPNLTLLFEIIYPENRVVVDYAGKEALVLIGARNRFTGEDYTYDTLLELCVRHAFPLPTRYDYRSPAEAIVNAIDLSANAEGYVLRHADGSRFKVKGEQYLLAHKLMTGISFKRVLEAVAADIYDDLIAGMPDEFLGTIKGYREQIDQTAVAILDAVAMVMRVAPRTDRKTFAQWVQANCKSTQAYMFAAFDNRDVLPLIYKNAFKKEVALEENTDSVRP